MAETPKPPPPPKRPSEAEERRLRQAEALRANLARRKAQTRARADDAAGDLDEVQPD